MKRRDFLKLGVAGAATLTFGRIPGLGVTNAYAHATQKLTITITDGLKDMHTKNTASVLITDPNPVPAQCYFWIYKVVADGVALPPDAPGPTICAVKGDSIEVSITNELDEPHSFFIPGIFNSGPIAPGATFTGTLTASVSGAHMYYDDLNAPVNRVMGLHGALIVKPAAAVQGHNFTPYDSPSPHVQALFDSFGTPVFPGLKWEQGDPLTDTPAFRTYAWLLHQASPNLFAEVGNLAPGVLYDPQLFTQKFLRDPFSPTRQNCVPQFFTMNGQSGFFSHDSPTITPMGRIGEPVVIHIMNAGLWTHSMHFHFNHFYVTYDNGVSTNPFWVDIYNIDPMDTVDYVLPFMRSPSIPTVLGLGLPTTPTPTINGHPCYPPVEEMNIYLPKLGTKAKNVNGNDISLAQRESPLCYPMHDHSEASQTSQGGNYNTGMISGAYCIGDRNAQSQGLGDFMDFPMDEDFAMMFRKIRGVSVASAADPARGTLPAPGTDATLPPL